MSFLTQHAEKSRIDPRVSDARAPELTDVLHIAVRMRLRLMLALLAGGILGVVWALTSVRPLYLATSTVMLNPRQQTILSLDGVVSGLTGDANVINTEVEVLQSRALMARVVRQNGLGADPEFNAALGEPGWPEIVLAYLPFWPPPAARNQTVEALAARTRIRNVPSSLVFEIGVTTGDPEKSARLANSIAKIYIRDQLEAKFRATEDATIWLTDRVADLEIELQKAEAAVSDFVAQTELTDPDTLSLLNAELKSLRERIAMLTGANGSARLARFEAAEGRAEQLQAVLDTGGDRQLEQLARRLGGVTGGPIARAFDLRFAALTEAARRGEGPTVEQLAALRRTEADLAARTDRQSTDLVALEQLEREAASARIIYEHFINRLKETSVQQGVQQADSRFLSPAVAPVSPVSPDLPAHAALGAAALFGLVLGSGLVAEGRKSVFRSAEELESATGLAVLGQIPLAERRGRAKILNQILTAPNSAMVEAQRNLRTSIVMGAWAKPPKVIVSTSTLPGEGKTTQSLALAQSFAAMGKDVVLVEGDIRRRTLDAYGKGPPRTRTRESGNLTAVLEGRVDLPHALRRDRKLGIDILHGGPSAGNAADIFSTEGFGQLVSHLRDCYDIVLIDTPPVLVVPDARVISRHADLVLYSVKWDATPRSQVQQGLRMFRIAGQTVGGLVLSQIDPARQRAYDPNAYAGAHYGRDAARYYAS